MSVVIKADTNELYRKVLSIKETAADIHQQLLNISGLMSDLGKYWQGDAYERHKTSSKAIVEDMIPIVAMLETRPDQLFKMAGIYETVEDFNKREAASLDPNVIE